MIRFVRTWRVTRDSYLDAVTWANELVEYLKKIEAFPETKVYGDMFGKIGTLRWYGDYEDLAAFEKATDILNNDQAFIELYLKGEKFLIEGAAYDRVMRQL